MEQFSMFVEYHSLGSSETKKDAPVLLEGTTEKDASAEAIAKADSLYPEHADYVLIRVIGSFAPGRPTAEIRPPTSN
jgi:hypothetical protein